MRIIPQPRGLAVTFDDDHAVANAGLVLPATLAERLGIEQVVDKLVDLGDRPGRGQPGGKALTCSTPWWPGRTASTTPTCCARRHRQRAGPPGAGAVHAGHVPALVHLRPRPPARPGRREALGRAWAAGAGPGDGPVTIDVDSTICEVYGHHKQGAATATPGELGYHPLLASLADTGEVLHSRLREGAANTARGAERFVNEPVSRVRRAGASGELTLRADSGFWTAKIMQRLPPAPASAARSPCARPSRCSRPSPPSPRRPGRRSITPTAGVAAGRRDQATAGERLIVRRIRRRPTQGRAVARLALPRLRHRPGRHRRGAGRRSPPPRRGRDRHPRPQRRRRAAPLPLRGVRCQRRLAAVLATLAHNLLRWVAAIGLGGSGLVVAKTLRRRLLALPGRLTRSARRRRLHLPTGWPWAAQFLHALARLRALLAPG